MAVRTEYVDVDFKFKLQKDMQEHEEICSTCNGLFFIVDDQRYGLREEGESINFRDPFPFHNQSLRQCPDCYWGVRKRCEHCCELIERHWVKCQKEKCKEKRGAAQWQIDQKEWEAVNKITYDEALTKFEQLYINSISKYCAVDELPEEIQNYIDDYDATLTDVLNLRIYTTFTTKATFDAYDILSNATEELHEDAFDRAKYVLDKMQNQLNELSEEISQDTLTYFPDMKAGILLTNEDIKKFDLKF